MRFRITIASLLLVSCAETTSEPNPEPQPADGKGDVIEVVECSYEITWLAESSADLEEYAWTLDEFDVVDGVASGEHDDQIVEAMAHLELIEPSDDIFDAFDAVDDERIGVWQLRLGDGEEATEYDWIRAYAGDTEVGVVFEDASTSIVAEISDGDILGCEYSTP